MRLRYKALLLDFYGTLVKDDGALVERVISHVGELSPLNEAVVGVRSRWYELMGMMCRDAHGNSFQTQRHIEVASLQMVLDEYQVKLDAGELCEDIFAYLARPEPYDDVAPFLTKVGVPVCIVSNIDDTEINSAIGHLGWSFPFVVTSERCRAYKPRAEMFSAALSLLNVSANDVLHIGDSPSADVRGAQGCGIDVAWLNRNNRSLTGQRPVSSVAGFGDLATRLGIG
ncbi:MAG TPA: HAD family hydrolase [Anaerolineae bacterium]